MADGFTYVPTPCIPSGGYPWPFGACLNGDDLNSAFNGSPGLSPPARIAAYKRWVDTALPPYGRQHYFDGAEAVYTGAFDTANHLWLPQIGGGVASLGLTGPDPGNIDIGSVPETFIQLTAAVTTLTGIGPSLALGAAKFLSFTPGTVLVDSAALAINAGTVTTAARDMAIAMATGGGNGLLLYLPRSAGGGGAAPAGDLQYATPVSGATVTMTTQDLVLEPAGPLNSLSIVLPAAPADGAIARGMTTQAILALTFNGGAHAVKGTPTYAAIGGAWALRYRVANTSWYNWT